MIARIEKLKAKAAPKKPEPKKPEPKKPEPKKPEPKKVALITEFAGRAAGDVVTPAAAWARAQELEKAPGKSARERAEAALPYYRATITLKNADGSRDPNCAAAALRMGQLVEKFAANDGERVSAGKYYMIAAHLDLGSPAWKSAEKLFVRAGQGAAFAKRLAALAAKTEAAGKKRLAASLKKRAAALAEKHGAK